MMYCEHGTAISELRCRLCEAGVPAYKGNRHARALGKLGGKVKSEKKAESSRKNGKLGGRPKKHPA